jgi:tetratricopeptide (TPR) repeat protein
MNQTIKGALRTGAFLLVFKAGAGAADAPINALWNDEDGFGIFLYGRPGSCAQFQYKNPPFLVVGIGNKRSDFRGGHLNATSLKVCMRATPPNVAFCTEGQIDVRYEASKNEYVGSYRLALSDGTSWSGPLRAQYCKSGELSAAPADREATRCSPATKDYNEANISRCTAKLALRDLSIRDRAMTFNIRGNTYDALGKYDLAIADYTEVVRLLPDFAYGYANRALEHCRKRNYQAALLDYDQALRLNPKNAYARYGRGVALRRFGDTARGNAELEAANQADPGVAAVYKEIGMEP